MFYMHILTKFTHNIMLFIYSNNIKINSHGLINNLIPMAHTQLYFYIIQSHINTLNFHGLIISFYTCPKPFILSNILLTTHMDHSRSNKQTGTIFNSPQNEQWAIRGQPSHQASVPLCGTEIHGHFQPNNS